MARTGGSSRLKLPESVELGLQSLGLVPFTPPGATATAATHAYVLPARPTFVVHLVASNIPGDAAVTVHWPGQRVIRLEPDPMLAILGQAIRDQLNPVAQGEQARAILDRLGL